MPQVGGPRAGIGWGELVCSLGVEDDDNSQMKICNKKQYMYFICAFEQ